MANLKEIKAKIGSVKNTQKTTRAMKLVSTAKLRRAEQLAKRSRDYALKINEVASQIAYSLNKHTEGGIDNKFFKIPEKVEKVDIIFVTADKGLCGGFNIQTIKRVSKMMESFKEQKVKVRLKAVGKKGIEYFRFKDIELEDEVNNLSSSPSYERAVEFIDKSIEDFKDGITDRVILIHNGFENMLTQVMHVNELLPISMEDCEDCNDESSSMDIEPENDEEVVLNSLIRKYIEFNMYYALIDSLAAEHSARMQAMDSASKNAKQMVEDLSLQYNKARQESITTELIEIISGVESMK
jgi:F-type H+-transporting ATPase subunit gamma